jgi:hypothetical protein
VRHFLSGSAEDCVLDLPSTGKLRVGGRVRNKEATLRMCLSMRLAFG